MQDAAYDSLLKRRRQELHEKIARVIEERLPNIEAAEPELLASMEEFGKLPRAVLSIAVREAYFHCGKALMRSKLWSSDSKIERTALPSISQIIHEQTKLGEPEPQATVEARYRTQL